MIDDNIYEKFLVFYVSKSSDPLKNSKTRKPSYSEVKCSVLENVSFKINSKTLTFFKTNGDFKRSIDNVVGSCRYGEFLLLHETIGFYRRIPENRLFVVYYDVYTKCKCIAIVSENIDSCFPLYVPNKSNDQDLFFDSPSRKAFVACEKTGEYFNENISLPFFGAMSILYIFCFVDGNLELDWSRNQSCEYNLDVSKYPNISSYNTCLLKSRS